MASELRLWAVSSGWSGPFQHEVVLVTAPDVYEAMERAERAFGEVSQPVCRAKVRARELGDLDGELLVGPLRSGESIVDGGVDLERRCDGPDGRRADDQPPVSTAPQGR